MADRFCSLKNLGDGAGTDGMAALADGEAQALLHGDGGISTPIAMEKGCASPSARAAIASVPAPSPRFFNRAVSHQRSAVGKKHLH